MKFKSSSQTLKVNCYVLCFQLDVGSDSESGAPNQGVSGPGQSNLSTEVAAALLIQREMASNRRRRSVEGFFCWRHLCKKQVIALAKVRKKNEKKSRLFLLNWSICFVYVKDSRGSSEVFLFLFVLIYQFYSRKLSCFWLPHVANQNYNITWT